MLNYWLDKIGTSGILLGPAISAADLVIKGKYTGPEQLYPGTLVLTGGLAAWNVAKCMREKEKGIKRSPLVHLGRFLETGGASLTAYKLGTGSVDNIYRSFGPAAIGIPAGAFLEYVIGPIQERFSKKYKTFE